MIEEIIFTGNERYLLILFFIIALFQLVKWICISIKDLVEFDWKSETPTKDFIKYLKRMFYI